MFFITILIGIVGHFFIIANPLFNADGIFYTHSLGAGSILGRWLIEILNTLFSFLGYIAVIPMFNIVIAIIILSFSAIYIQRILEIDDIIDRLIISLLLVLSPAMVQTFFYGFTAHIYSLSILFTVLSVYYLLIKDNLVISIYLNCIALAIYQAYIPFYLCIFLMYFVKNIINEPIDKNIKILLKSILSFLLSFLLYYMINEIVNRINGNFIAKLHGMSEYIVPNFTFKSVIASIVSSYKAFFDMVLKHNEFAHNTTVFIRIIYFIIFMYTLYLLITFVYIYAFKRSLYNDERKIAFSNALILVIFYILSPIFINFMFIMTNNNILYTDDRLALSLIFYLIYPLVLTSNIYKFKSNFKYNLKTISVVLSIIVLMHNMWLAYGSYYNQFKIINASKAFAQGVASNIKMLDGYNNDTAVLFIGTPYEKNSHFNYGYYVEADHNLYSNFDVEYENILCEYPMKQIFKEFTALDFNEPKKDFANNLYYSKEVREMPIYPVSGSVKLVENVAVVKFKEPIY